MGGEPLSVCARDWNNLLRELRNGKVVEYLAPCLGSPTRKEVDAAHAKGKILDVGILSIQNLNAVSRERKFLWAGLVISALPLHFLYNSVLFLTTQANIYSAIPVDERFVRTGYFNTSSLHAVAITTLPHASSPVVIESDSAQHLVNTAKSIRDKFNETNRPRQISAADCLRAYSTQYVSSRGDVLIVQSPPVSQPLVYIKTSDRVEESSDTIGGYTVVDEMTPVPKEMIYQSQPRSYPSYEWTCSPRVNKTCSVDHQQQYIDNPLTWKPYGQSVQYCLSEEVPEQCQLNFSLLFAVVVVISNFVKVVCMFLILWRHDKSALITIGDAIGSFLDHPDPHTRGLCILPPHLIQLLLERRQGGSQGAPGSGFAPAIVTTKNDFLNDPKSRQWRPGVRRWWHAVAISRWLLCSFLYLVMFLIAIIFYFEGLHGQSTGWSSLSHFGIGDVVGNNIITMNNSMFATVIIANLPQVIISYIYVLFNSLYTCMVVGREWTQFATNRKTLRVSSPVGAQRSTYWLQLPYRYSVPLIISSSLLAWLASQSLFMVKINVLDDYTRTVQADKSILSCGYSPGAIVLAIIVGTLIMLGAALLGLRTYTPGMPLAATCSAAISAACHAPEDDPDAAVLPVQWGVVSVKDGIGHCCFSSKLVAPPIPGQMYA
ncbi:MAG: hypothetical protein Q9181_005758 [Wetmoreana brouardii]